MGGRCRPCGVSLERERGCRWVPNLSEGYRQTYMLSAGHWAFVNACNKVSEAVARFEKPKGADD